MNQITLILPYYNQPEMLSQQLMSIDGYQDIFKVIIVDDGSQDFRANELSIFGVPRRFAKNISIYRIIEDIPWNRNGARNLGATVANTEWILQTDIDHILSPINATRLINTTLDKSKWYQFARSRIGQADETRRKDALDPNAEEGEIKPHIDSYLITRERFLSSPYDERYRGFLGGGSPFLARMKRLYGEPELLSDVRLNVFTRHMVPDSSTQGLSRDTSQYKELRRQIQATGDDTPIKPLNFKWQKVL